MFIFPRRLTSDNRWKLLWSAWTEEGTSDNDDYSVLNIRTIYNTNGLETKKLVKIGLGEDSKVNLNFSVDSASPISVLKQNVLHELKLRNPKVIQATEKFVNYTAASPTTQSISSGKIVVRIQSNGGIFEETPFFITTGHERNNLINDNLPRIGIEKAQRQPILPVNNVTLPESCKLNTYSNTILNLHNNFKGIFNRVGKLPLDRKITHFHTPFKSIQTKGRGVPLHLLESVKIELNKMEQVGHIVKLIKCDKECFISPIAITRKNDGSIKLALDSKLLNGQIFKNK